MAQIGRGIFLGKPIAAKGSGLCIGRPGLMFFGEGPSLKFAGLEIDFSGDFRIDFTTFELDLAG